LKLKRNDEQTEGLTTIWLFTKSGFYSVVIDSQNDGRMLIRSRCKADIHNLYREHAAALSSMTPLADSGTCMAVDFAGHRLRATKIG
jgi:hypothetical protein